MCSAEDSGICRPHGAENRAGDRFLALAVLLLSAAAVAVALCLRPDARGYGTHTQLHLPACIFRQLTGLPCPSCGMTTSVAFMARLEVGRAFLIHPFGCIGFPVVIFTGVFSASSLLFGAAFGRAMGSIFCPKVLFFLGILFLLSWGFTLARAIFAF